MKPAYRRLNEQELQARIEASLAILPECRLCPRQCRINRLDGETGFCQTGRWAKIASYTLHFGEETPLVGQRGSGTIFFAGCNLGCSFCQNYEISHSTNGAIEAGPEQLAAVMLDLQGQGAENINLVTPSHVLPQVLEALPVAIRGGLELPLVYNSSGYDQVSSLGFLDGIVDIYMPDAKFSAAEPAERYCQARDYPDKAREAILEMHRQVGDLTLDERNLAKQGLLVRHLVMPNDVSGTENWFRFLAEKVSRQTYLNIMDQYRPCGDVAGSPELGRSITQTEFSLALDLAEKYGLHRLDRRDRYNLRDLIRRLNR
jgi:putative pyruvate formate lyase activating enzyme